jgi:Tfp pilus assembly protein PilV
MITREIEKGATLVEAVIAMFILSLIIIGLNAGVMMLIKSNIASKELSAATSNAYSLIEDLRIMDYSDLESDEDLVNSKYKRTWTVSDQTSQKQINVFIFWPYPSTTHRIQLSTIIAKP